MMASKRKYYCYFLFTMMVAGVLLIISTLVANHYFLHIEVLHKIITAMVITMVAGIGGSIAVILRINKGIKNTINKYILLSNMETNLIAIGAYNKVENKNYVVLPKIKIKNGIIKIKLKDLRIRKIIERYMDSFSTALPKQYIVDDYYISKNNADIIIKYENINNYKPEEYSLVAYKEKVQALEMLQLYFDKKHIVNVNDHPHFLISGASGSGKSYLANQIVIQTILKGWQVVICDIKRSYGLYKEYTDYCYEMDDILKKLQSVEAEMKTRMQKLQPVLDENPQTVAVDIGYKPMLIVIEEYISLQSALDKKQKEELERVVKNLSVLARQSNIHLMLVMQSASTENINATTRSNLTKVLLGNAQSNILNATFGNGVDIPNMRIKFNKGEGFIQLDRITILRIPKINDMDCFKYIIS